MLLFNLKYFLYKRFAKDKFTINNNYKIIIFFNIFNEKLLFLTNLNNDFLI